MTFDTFTPLARRATRIALLVCAAAAGAEAITVAPMSFEQLVRESGTVVYARVAEVEGRWNADRNGIESLLTATVLDTFKGAERETQQFLLPGGEAGGRINVIPGAPVLREGDLVVLFLAGAGPSIPRPVGLTQGVIRVVPDARSGAAMVPAPATAGTRATRGGAARAPIALEAFASMIRATEARR